jgi:hypothetical protein
VSIYPTVSRPKCHADADAWVAHWFRNVGLWEVAVACAVETSFERRAMLVNITL